MGIVCEVTLDTEGSPQTRLSHVWLAWTLPRPQGYGCSQIRCSVIHTGLQPGFFRPASPCPPWTAVGRGPQRESHPVTGDRWPLWAWALHITPAAGPGAPAQWDTFLPKSCWGPARSPPGSSPRAGEAGEAGKAGRLTFPPGVPGVGVLCWSSLQLPHVEGLFSVFEREGKTECKQVRVPQRVIKVGAPSTRSSNYLVGSVFCQEHG